MGILHKKRVGKYLSHKPNDALVLLLLFGGMMSTEGDRYLKESKKRMVEQIIRSGESFQEQSIYCPHCGHDQEGSQFECMPETPDEEGQQTCKSCEKDYLISFSHVFSTRILE